MASSTASSLPFIDSQQASFQDAIHKLVNFSRPLASEEKTKLGELLLELIALCGSDPTRWRTVVLALTHKRYHSLSPTGQEEGGSSGGEGERLVFYSSFRFLFEQMMMEENESTTLTDESKCLLAALKTMIKIAPHAGGSRDICQLLLDMIEVVLTKSKTIDRAKQAQIAMRGHASLPGIVGECIRDIEKFCKAKNGIISLLFGDLLQLAANTLDSDFEIIQRVGEAYLDQEREFPSTLHIFVPHRDRGRPKKPKRDQKRHHFSERQLMNSVAEILIWSRTQKASTVPAFAESHRHLLERSSRGDDKKELTILQTVVRTLRKALNSYAREQGFMLSTQFAMQGSSTLSSRQVNSGKSGDLKSLTRLATKKCDQKVLKLIQLRGAAGKVTKFASVREALEVPVAADNGDAEIEAIERDIYLERLRATLLYLRSLMKSHEKSVVVASMDKCNTSHALAVLVVAAMSSWTLSEAEADPAIAPSKATAKLLMAGVRKEMICIQDVMNLLGNIASGLDKNELDVQSFMDSDGAATTKAVMNTIGRHVQDSEIFLLVTGADISFPSEYMKALSNRGCSMHCHDSDDIGARLQRERAQKGDVTVSLFWNTTDDLDLHVFVPGGEELSFCNTLSKDKLCGLDVDMNAGKKSNEPVENVFLGDLDKKLQAPLGHYKVVVQNYSYHGSLNGSAVPFRVILDKDGKKEKYDGQCKGTGSSSNVVVCEFDYEGRSVPFPFEEKETAFTASNMVNMTASTGQTLESVGQLVQIAQQHEHIGIVRPLLIQEDENSAAMLVEDVVADPVTPTLEVTSQDIISILLAKLPAKFHQIVGDSFGGPSLAESCAESIARRMVADRIAITELKRNEFPDDIIQAVKVKMATIDAV